MPRLECIIIIEKKNRRRSVGRARGRIHGPAAAAAASAAARRVPECRAARRSEKDARRLDVVGAGSARGKTCPGRAQSVSSAISCVHFFLPLPASPPPRRRTPRGFRAVRDQSHGAFRRQNGRGARSPVHARRHDNDTNDNKSYTTGRRVIVTDAVSDRGE